MGRPPIGKRAMTTAERTRRHRLKHGGAARPAERTYPPPLADEAAALRSQLQERDAEVARLKAENARLAASVQTLTRALNAKVDKELDAEFGPRRPRAGYTPHEYKTIASMLHPDRWPEEMKAKAHNAFILFAGIEKNKTDRMAARAATRERNSARSKAAWEKRKQAGA